MNSILELLRQIVIFQGLDFEELERIAPLFSERKVPKGTVLFCEGDPGHEMYIIKSGLVKIHRLESNREIILTLFRQGDYFGEMALITPGQTRSATAETLETTELYVLLRENFNEFLLKTPSIMMKLLETTMERMRRTNEQIEDLSFLDVRSRIIKLIIRLGEEYGKPVADGVLIEMKLTHQHIANMAGTVRESVTKILQELQLEQVIDVQSKMILIRRAEELQKKIMY
ncbi:Crp/Fnr family transcriptional regulator [Paenibacillus turpanensis]|uniref:Crp/Fnr family transcriptional regulator n=1 Tax=Paenibacillus turpanensis TaxID=2689078 RepID=UPI001408E607|nr:Crp/Fnr family transcriptional regulator [Paenibacillus turpanensis]